MLLGIITPALTMLPAAHAGWEEDAAWHDVVAIAQAADRLGYHHLTCSEHIAVPQVDARIRGGRYWDPLASFGYLAAVTSNIRFATYVLVLGYHHPLAIAKRYGTLDQVSDGRLILGVGVGTLRAEFELLGAAFEDRGPRADDALRALRAAFGTELPEYHGPFYAFGGVVVSPSASRRGVPIWVGGQGARSLRRAVALADGWAPFGVTSAHARELLERARETDDWRRRSRPIDVILQPRRPLDPIGDAGAARAVLAELRDAGATHATLRFVHHSPGHFVEQLEAAKGLVG